MTQHVAWNNKACDRWWRGTASMNGCLAYLRHFPQPLRLSPLLSLYSPLSEEIMWHLTRKETNYILRSTVAVVTTGVIYVTFCTCLRWRCLKRLQHGLLHLLSVEGSIPDPQLCTWEHILGNRRHVSLCVEINPEAQVWDRCRYLGGVEVHITVLLVSRQILVLVVGRGSHQHHPVAVFLAAGVKAHNHGVLLEDLHRDGRRVT